MNEELAGPRDPIAYGYGKRWLEDFTMKRGMVFGSIIVAAMLAFELFNYSTTDFALANLLGDLRFIGIRWAMILAIAFCGIDFAGIARLFTPEKGRGEHVEVWYLLTAWFLAATMNAMLTWWGVSLALLQHNSLGNEILSRQTLLTVVPVFVAIMVWLIRILMIGTMSMAGERLFSFGQPEAEPVSLDAWPEPDDDDDEAAGAPRATATTHMPTAVWRGSGNGGHSLPMAPMAPMGPPSVAQTRPARVIGMPSSDEPTQQQQRMPTVAERHGYGFGRSQQPARPAAPTLPPTLPGQAVRPAPKPAASATPRPPSASTATHVTPRPPSSFNDTSGPTDPPPQRPVISRASEGVKSNGNGNGNGNGHSHSPSPSRSFDPDLDD